MTRSVDDIVKHFRGFKNVVFYCADPGAYAVLSIVAMAILEEKHVQWCLKGWAAKNAPVPGGLRADFPDILRAVSSETVVVIGGQRDFQKTVKVIKACRKKGFHTIFIFDHWANFSKHFYDTCENRVYLPDRILLMDELAKNILIRELRQLDPGIKCGEKVFIVDHPYIESRVESIRSIENGGIAVMRKKWNPDGRYLISFLSEPIAQDFGCDENNAPVLGFDEYTVLSFLSGYLGKKFPVKKVKLLVKPPPRQDVHKLKEHLEKNFELEWQLAENSTLEEVIAVSDEVYGMTSLALILAMKAGKKITSVQVGRNDLARAEHSNPFFEAVLLV